MQAIEYYLFMFISSLKVVPIVLYKWYRDSPSFSNDKPCTKERWVEIASCPKCGKIKLFHCPARALCMIFAECAHWATALTNARIGQKIAQCALWANARFVRNIYIYIYIYIYILGCPLFPEIFMRPLNRKLFEKYKVYHHGQFIPTSFSGPAGSRLFENLAKKRNSVL